MATDTRDGATPGLMMETPLQIRSIAHRAEFLFPDREVVGVTATGVERSTWGEVIRRARRLASALEKLGIGPGDRVATFGWNSIRHLELYFAVPCMGAVLHTLNIRLFEPDLRYIVDHAEDRIVFLDSSLAHVMPRFDRIEHEILMPDAPNERPGALAYEELLSTGEEGYEFPDMDEDRASAMCYTSGTTGRPKGVVYSHRSTVLHTLIVGQACANGLREQDVSMPIVPMFHANGWGVAYTAAMAGAKLVLPGPRMDPESLARTIESEGVTSAAAIPTIWLGIAQLEPHPDFSKLERVMCGGAAVPESLIRLFAERFDAEITQGWGMTETSPVGTVGSIPPDVTDVDEAFTLRATQGRIAPLIEMRIDEEAGGELQVRGPTVARAYYRDEASAEKFTEDGWLRTGDVAELAPRGYLRLVDRTKDLVKSGGEWISSVELENAIMAHPDVTEAAVVAVPDARWTERPCACVVRRSGSALDAEQLREFLVGRVAKWWVPERVEFIDEVPRTSVGKFDKKVLRAQIADGTLHTVE